MTVRGYPPSVFVRTDCSRVTIKPCPVDFVIDRPRTICNVQNRSTARPGNTVVTRSAYIFISAHFNRTRFLDSTRCLRVTRQLFSRLERIPCVSPFHSGRPTRQFPRDKSCGPAYPERGSCASLTESRRGDSVFHGRRRPGLSFTIRAGRPCTAVSPRRS